jgi:PAS domain S-box-containing protein
MSSESGHNVPDPAAQELTLLLQRLNEAESALRVHLEGQRGAFAGQSDSGSLLAQARQSMVEGEAVRRQAAGVQTAILDALPANIALVNPEGLIVAVNESWRRFGLENSALDDHFFVGKNYLEICESTEGECAADARATAAGIRAVLAGRQTEFSLEYPCHSSRGQAWYRVIVSSLRPGGLSGVVVMHLDVTARKQAELALSESEGRQRRLAAQ